VGLSEVHKPNWKIFLLDPCTRKTSFSWLGYTAGVLASVGWQDFWRPSPKVDPGAFGVQR